MASWTNAADTSGTDTGGVGAAAASDGQIQWTVPSTPGGAFKIHLVSASLAGVDDLSDAAFSVASGTVVAPLLTIVLAGVPPRHAGSASGAPGAPDTSRSRDRSSRTDTAAASAAAAKGDSDSASFSSLPNRVEAPAMAILYTGILLKN